MIQVGRTTGGLGGSHLGLVGGDPGDGPMPRVDLATAPTQLRAVADLIQAGLAVSAHDCSEGGLLVAAAEMAFAGRQGLALDLTGVPRHEAISQTAACFAETPSRILLEVSPDRFKDMASSLAAAGVPFGQVGTFNDSNRLEVTDEAGASLASETLEDLLNTWRAPLDW